MTVKIPQKLQGPINAAFPSSPILIATVLPNGYAQVTLRGSTLVLDDTHLATWERGKGTTAAGLHDGSKVTAIFLLTAQQRETLPLRGGMARLYGTAKIVKSGPVYEEVWSRVVQPEKDRDPEKKGFAVVIEIESVEDLSGAPITD